MRIDPSLRKYAALMKIRKFFADAHEKAAKELITLKDMYPENVVGEV